MRAFDRFGHLDGREAPHGGALGATSFMPAVYVPLLLFPHIIVFGLHLQQGRRGDEA